MGNTAEELMAASRAHQQTRAVIESEAPTTRKPMIVFSNVVEEEVRSVIELGTVRREEQEDNNEEEEEVREPSYNSLHKHGRGKGLTMQKEVAP